VWQWSEEGHVEDFVRRYLKNRGEWYERDIAARNAQLYCALEVLVSFGACSHQQGATSQVRKCTRTFEEELQALIAKERSSAEGASEEDIVLFQAEMQHRIAELRSAEHRGMCTWQLYQNNGWFHLFLADSFHTPKAISSLILTLLFGH